MMPCPVVVGKRAYDLGKHVRPDGLVERRTESPVGHHAELPRTTATMDAAVVRRRVRRPPEPPGDREVRGGIGRAHVCTPVTLRFRMPSSACTINTAPLGRNTP